jgi:Zn-dependent protease
MSQLSLVQQIAIWALPILFAITVHEVAHGWVARLHGDRTAELLGRLTLNPIKHIDLVGTIIVPVVLLALGGFIFGWAKPVPVAQQNLRNPRRDMALVAAAGPVSNLVMALLWGLIAKLAAVANIAWASEPLILMGIAGVTINLVLAVLNLLPIPPLDGGRVLSNLLPARYSDMIDRIEPYGLLILVALLAMGILGQLIGPPIMLLRGLIFSLFGLG